MTDTCPTHGDWDANRESGCPHCVREMRPAVHAMEDLLLWIRNEGENYWGSDWSEDICPILERHGLMCREPYDPDKHGSVDADPGMIIWTFTPDGLAAIAAAEGRVDGKS